MRAAFATHLPCHVLEEVAAAVVVQVEPFQLAQVEGIPPLVAWLKLREEVAGHSGELDNGKGNKAVERC